MQFSKGGVRYAERKNKYYIIKGYPVKANGKMHDTLTRLIYTEMRLLLTTIIMMSEMLKRTSLEKKNYVVTITKIKIHSGHSLKLFI